MMMMDDDDDDDDEDDDDDGFDTPRRSCTITNDLGRPTPMISLPSTLVSPRHLPPIFFLEN